MPDKKSNRIPADQLTAYERWELPSMQPGGNDVIRSQVSSAEIPVKPLTAADLEKIRLEAYQAGFDQGKEEGLQAGHKEGLEKGFQEGLESGKQQGLQEGQAAGQQQKQSEIDENIARLNSIMKQLLDPIKLHEDELEEALLNLVLAISRAVIMRELSIDSQQVRKTLSDALASLPTSASNVKVWVNSEDFETVVAVTDAIAEGVQVIKSDEILPGGCKVETLHSQIDATVEKRFQKTVQQMLDQHSSSLPTDEVPDLADSMDDMTDFHRDVLESEEDENAHGQSPDGNSADGNSPDGIDKPSLDSEAEDGTDSIKENPSSDLSSETQTSNLMTESSGSTAEPPNPATQPGDDSNEPSREN
ncbi:flagellar assembly protein FliH [Alkalimarinus coralli]|uniref:flagellar assembly protein FliH n=1 Tax=Alkalimarinus coralli TaxID=2935863 RepID=UPI00202B03D5|nr:flagellar assembly protein FliH [Alkalimarinus coralli]